MLYIDTHTHPNYKPFARAHLVNGEIAQMSLNPDDETSLWHYDSRIEQYNALAQYLERYANN